MGTLKRALLQGMLLCALAVVPFGMSQASAASYNQPENGNNDAKIEKTGFRVYVGRPYYYGRGWGGGYYRPYRYGYYNNNYYPYYRGYWGRGYNRGW